MTITKLFWRFRLRGLDYWTPSGAGAQNTVFPVLNPGMMVDAPAIKRRAGMAIAVGGKDREPVSSRHGRSFQRQDALPDLDKVISLCNQNQQFKHDDVIRRQGLTSSATILQIG